MSQRLGVSNQPILAFHFFAQNTECFCSIFGWYLQKRLLILMFFDDVFWWPMMTFLVWIWKVYYRKSQCWWSSLFPFSFVRIWEKKKDILEDDEIDSQPRYRQCIKKLNMHENLNEYKQTFLIVQIGTSLAVFSQFVTEVNLFLRPEKKCMYPFIQRYMFVQSFRALPVTNTLREPIFAGTNFCGFCGFGSKSQN